MDAINNAQIGETIELNSVLLKSVKFTYSNELGYSWVAYYKNNYLYKFPLLGSSTVKFFKTLVGAKRNFVKNNSEFIRGK